jgi:hypothetical protein
MHDSGTAPPIILWIIELTIAAVRIEVPARRVDIGRIGTANSEFFPDSPQNWKAARGALREGAM